MNVDMTTALPPGANPASAKSRGLPADRISSIHARATVSSISASIMSVKAANSDSGKSCAGAALAR